MRYGVFGGTFDPPHIAHLVLAEEALDQLQLDRILWVLTPIPPHKPDQAITPLEYRLLMLQAALSDNPNFELSRVDIDRKPPHYAVGTVTILKALLPGSELVYLMGGDSLVELPTWHTPEAFVAACNEVGVMYRPGWKVDLKSVEDQIPGVSSKVRIIRAPLLEISSTDLRRRIASGRPFRYFLPERVYAIIRDRHLYR